MPRIALLVLCVLGGCSFEADYAGGVYRCSDQQSKCPLGMVCQPNLDNDLVCQPERMDAAVDVPGMGDGMPIDGPPKHDLNCPDPQPLVNGVSFTETTKDRTNKVHPSCFNGVMNGLDAVHIISPGTAGIPMLVKVEAGFAATAYVLSACGGQAACNGNNYATPGNSISVTSLAGPHYIIVDSVYPTTTSSGEYTLTVSF
jgi:hypothetical protein